MNQPVDVIQEREEYQCRNYGRLFWVRAAGRTGLDLDFGYPYGRDETGPYMCSRSVRMGKAKRTAVLDAEEPKVRS